jgi:hypothetical protein
MTDELSVFKSLSALTITQTRLLTTNSFNLASPIEVRAKIGPDNGKVL